jgi:hypothetical protein
MWNRRHATHPLAALILLLSGLGAFCNAAAAEPVATPAATMAPTEADLRSEFESRSWAYDEYLLRHIFIAVGPAAGHKKPRSESQALARAWALKRQLDAGKDFSRVAQRESDDAATAAIGGELSSMFGVYVANEFIGTVRELAVGEVSKPTRGRDGYHLIRLEERHATDFDMARPMIEQQLQDHARAAPAP